MTVLMTRSLSDYFLRNAGIELNISIASDYYYRCMLLCGEVPRHSVSHLATSKPVLQASKPKQMSNRFFTIYMSTLNQLRVLGPIA